MPRFSLVARSFSQLSMTMKAPAMAKPVKTRSTIQTIGSMTRPVIRAMMAAEAAKAPKARTWPTRRTSRGANRQPPTKPAAQAVPSKPSEAVENPSAWPRSGKSKACRPDPASRKAVPRNSARIGPKDANIVTFPGGWPVICKGLSEDTGFLSFQGQAGDINAWLSVEIFALPPEQRVGWPLRAPRGLLGLQTLDLGAQLADALFELADRERRQILADLVGRRVSSSVPRRTGPSRFLRFASFGTEVT